MNRAYSSEQWRKDFARAFAAAVPLENLPTQARGLLLMAQNQEPEPQEFNPLLIDGVEHDALCLKVIRAPGKECTCGAQPPPSPSAKADAARQRQYEQAMRLERRLRDVPEVR